MYEPGLHHVYVRDRKSVNGTYVNGISIRATSGIATGYLLQHGDIVEIRPHWAFHLSQVEGLLVKPRSCLQEAEIEVWLIPF